MEVIALLAMIALVLIVLAMYWLPSIIGYYRRTPHIFSVVVTNALLGWTVVGWLVAMSMAARGPAASLSKRPAS